MTRFKCIKCSASFEDEITGILYCPYCGEVQPLPPDITEEQKELIYNEAVLVADRARNVENLSEVVSIFEQLGSYKDSIHQIDRCKRKLTELKNNAIYEKALACMEKESIRGYKQAIELFEQIPDWRNSSFKIDEAKVKLDALLERLEKRKQLAMKITMIVSACLIALAILLYVFLEFILPAIRYAGAKGDLEDKEYEKAYATLEDLGDYKDSATLIKQSKYERGLEYLNAGDALNACKMFGGAKGYNDAEQRQLAICKTLSIKEQIELLEEGNTVLFGKYEQDLTVDGKETLDWVIVQKDQNKALIVSKKAIEATPYGVSGTKWSNSALRNWLNSNFIDENFTTTEKRFLLNQITTTIYKDAEGNETVNISDDRAIILSENELNRFFSSEEERCALGTDYLKSKGVYVNQDNGMTHYWLRSATTNGNIKYVNGSGGINQDGKSPMQITSVRPAVWIDLD
ncbi:MAG: hypothetical protein IJF11_01735 [Clostridia bacterium]|nr:hypothetical protein [Clostridia bacterium]